jgi:hypothetical protein
MYLLQVRKEDEWETVEEFECRQEAVKAMRTEGNRVWDNELKLTVDWT